MALEFFTLTPQFAFGHVWNAINNNGKVSFLDGQAGWVGADALRNSDYVVDYQLLLVFPGK
jgi:hypothetical protein